MTSGSEDFAHLKGLASCVHCGVQVRLNPKKVGSTSTRDGSTLSGWYHHDGMLRDHTAVPDDRETSQEAARMVEMNDRARATVRGQLRQQFDHLTAEQVVNDIGRDSGLGDLFNDRRGGKRDR